ncbi:alpha/beta hydrolase fold domain-containing protein [Roseovarius litoreus]|uniref:alpha/beta hydrolase fold domain-containing protein n=1 Tax=Roseovarius litoreus TaxID=1155722 RepID=UPI00122C5DD8|nr:alpha/beta hydrolase fold domain-containing protein [Roseovarius litoreus]
MNEHQILKGFAAAAHGPNSQMLDPDAEKLRHRRIEKGVVRMQNLSFKEARVCSAGLDDSATVIRRAAAHGATLNLDTDKLIFSGDSSGATFAAMLAIMARAGALPRSCTQVLLHPPVDGTWTSPSYSFDMPRLILFGHGMRFFSETPTSIARTRATGEPCHGSPKTSEAWNHSSCSPPARTRRKTHASPMSRACRMPMSRCFICISRGNHKVLSRQAADRAPAVHLRQPGRNDAGLPCR